MGLVEFTFVPEVMYESRHTGVVVILVWPAHGPVDARDGELDSLSSLVLVQVHILKHEGEDMFPVPISCVQLLGAVGGTDVLGSDDWEDGLALIQASTYSAMPVTA